MPDYVKAVTKAVKDPVGAAEGLLKDVGKELGKKLGIGRGADPVKYARRQRWQQRMVQLAEGGDKMALNVLAAIGRVHGLYRAAEGEYVEPDSPVQQLPRGWTSKAWGWYGYKNLIRRARAHYYRLGGSGAGEPEPEEDDSWREDTGGTAPPAAPPSAPPKPSPSEPPAPSAPSGPTARPKPAPKPCPRGKVRNPETGRCRKARTTAEGPGYGITMQPGGAKPKKPCKYGPRGPDGYCPKKPTGLAGGRLTRGQNRLLRRVETAAGNVAAKGAKGAITAITAALSGVSIKAAAGVSVAVVAAAALGWLIGQDVRRSLSGENKELRIEQINRDRRYAVAAMREKLGRQPTLDEQRPITEAYNKRLRLIREGGFN